MTEVLTGSARTAPLPGQSTLVLDRYAAIRLQFRGLNTANDRALAFGSAASTPGTYAGLTGAQQQPLVDQLPLTLRQNPSAGVDAEVSLTLQLTSPMASGHHLYACLFAVDPAISGSVPDLVVDLGEIF